MLLTCQIQIKDRKQILWSLRKISPINELSIIYPDILTVKKLTVDLDVPLSVIANQMDLKFCQMCLHKKHLKILRRRVKRGTYQ